MEQTIDNPQVPINFDWKNRNTNMYFIIENRGCAPGEKTVINIASKNPIGVGQMINVEQIEGEITAILETRDKPKHKFSKEAMNGKSKKIFQHFTKKSERQFEGFTFFKLEIGVIRNTLLQKQAS